MAAVSIITISLRDDAGKRASIPVYVPATALQADIEALADVIAGHLDAVTGAVIEGMSITLNHALPAGLKVAAVDDALNGMGVLFSFDAAATNYAHSVYVPAINPALVDDGVVDPTVSPISLLVTDLADGSGTVDPSDRYANDLLTLLGAEIRFRKL